MPLDPIHLFHYVEFHVFTFLLMISVIFWWWFLILLFTHPLTYPFLFSPLLFSILLLPRVCFCACMCVHVLFVWPQTQLCLPLHILEERGLPLVAGTVRALLELAPPKYTTSPVTTTNPLAM